MGFETVAHPLFQLVARVWEAPDAAGFDGVLLTSANALRFGGSDLRRCLSLPAYAVGAATAAAARSAGFHDVIDGDRDVAGLVGQAADRGARRLLHLAGEDRTPFDAPGITIETRVVYASLAVPPPPGLADVLARNPIALLHSARAARRFAELVDERTRIALVAISAGVAEVAGSEWEEVAVSPEPRDEAMLALAAHIQGSR